MNEFCECRLCQVIHPAIDSIREKVTDDEMKVVHELYERMQESEVDKAVLRYKIKRGKITDVEDCLPYLRNPGD